MSVFIWLMVLTSTILHLYFNYKIEHLNQTQQQILDTVNMVKLSIINFILSSCNCVIKKIEQIKFLSLGLIAN